MTTSTVMKKVSIATVGTVFLSLAFISKAQAAALAPSFSNFYSVTDLGVIPNLPETYAGMTFKAGDPNILLIGGAANTLDAKIFAVTVMRDNNDRIIGFEPASFFANAPGINQGGVDASLAYSPKQDVLFYTSFDDNSIGQIKQGSTNPDKQIDLNTLGIPPSTGGLNFVPKGFAGAGRLKFTSYNANLFYDTTIKPDGSGTYDINPPGKSIELSGGLDSFNYIKAGNPGFNQDSLLLLEYDAGKIAAYAIDDNGDPKPDTRQDFLTDIANPIGSTIDPVTGDLLLSSQSLNQVFVIRGFRQPTSVPEPQAISAASLAVLGLSLLLKKKVVSSSK
ncbi:MAG TPA: hypothetical protein DCL61_25975 [Cyanobacteria bacterium UBA12227]|nr:hypothetical protein [Cyanobacteria bacterium UBA12227]HAX85644.1 hypothetical protein [Cyanobacteria bacterium UBA11370]HBY79858.1 hypothetical protein [Cyanobacteria bacterium UBA11148]